MSTQVNRYVLTTARDALAKVTDCRDHYGTPHSDRDAWAVEHLTLAVDALTALLGQVEPMERWASEATEVVLFEREQCDKRMAEQRAHHADLSKRWEATSRDVATVAERCRIARHVGRKTIRIDDLLVGTRWDA